MTTKFEDAIKPSTEPVIFDMTPGEPFTYGPGDWDGFDHPPQPYNATGHICHYWSFHSGGANFLSADGHVQKIPYTISQDKINALATRAGNEAIGKVDWE